MSNGLERCPFCDSEHVFCTDWHEGRGYGIKCGDCGKIWGPFTKPETAYENWNKRAEKMAKVECIAEVYRGEIVDHYLSGMCGICGETVYDYEKYCPDCGAKQDWGK